MLVFQRINAQLYAKNDAIHHDWDFFSVISMKALIDTRTFEKTHTKRETLIIKGRVLTKTIKKKTRHSPKSV